MSSPKSLGVFLKGPTRRKISGSGIQTQWDKHRNWPRPSHRAIIPYSKSSHIRTDENSSHCSSQHRGPWPSRLNIALIRSYLSLRIRQQQQRQHHHQHQQHQQQQRQRQRQRQRQQQQQQQRQQRQRQQQQQRQQQLKQFLGLWPLVTDKNI